METDDCRLSGVGATPPPPISPPPSASLPLPLSPLHIPGDAALTTERRRKTNTVHILLQRGEGGEEEAGFCCSSFLHKHTLSSSSPPAPAPPRPSRARQLEEKEEEEDTGCDRGAPPGNICPEDSFRRPSLNSSSAAGERCVDIASHRTRRRVSQCSLPTVPRLLRVTLVANILTAPLTGGDQSSQGNM